MKRIILYSLILFVTFGCKSDKKEKPNAVKSDIKSEEGQSKREELKLSSFERRLLDLRDVNKQFNEAFKIEKFGMLQLEENLYGFVFKLDENTTEGTVEKYSVGIKGFNREIDSTFRASFAPEIKTRNNKKYLILTRKLEKEKYFDSLDVYIFERKNWKASGRLGTIKIRDIFFEKE